MKNKLTKTILLIIILIVFSTTVLATTIGQFMQDISTNPQDYYVLYTDSEPEIISALQTFATQVVPGTSLTFSTSIIPDKKYITAKIADNYDSTFDYSYIELDETGTNDFLLIYLDIEEDYIEYLLANPSLITTVNADGDDYITSNEILVYNLNTILNNLRTSSAMDTSRMNLMKDQLESNQPTPVPCADFIPFNHSIYEKDVFDYQGTIYEDKCSYELLNELECFETTLSIHFIECEHGCLNGVCLQKPLIEESDLFSLIKQSDWNLKNFFKIANSWVSN